MNLFFIHVPNTDVIEIVSGLSIEILFMHGTIKNNHGIDNRCGIPNIKPKSRYILHPTGMSSIIKYGRFLFI